MVELLAFTKCVRIYNDGFVRKCVQKTMETYHGRACIPKKGIQFFYDNDDDVFRMALTRLHMQYRTYWPLKALGLPKQFHSEENMKAVCCMPSALSYASV